VQVMMRKEARNVSFLPIRRVVNAKIRNLPSGQLMTMDHPDQGLDLQGRVLDLGHLVHDPGIKNLQLTSVNTLGVN